MIFNLNKISFAVVTLICINAQASTILGSNNDVTASFGTIVVGNNNDTASSDGSGYAVGNNNKDTGFNIFVGNNNKGSGGTASGSKVNWVMGNNNTANGDGVTIQGTNNTVGTTGDSSTVIGGGNTVTGSKTVVTGNNNIVSGNSSTAVGNQVTVTGDNAVGLGSNVTASGNNSAAIGDFASATGNNTSAFGAGATASNEGDVALGSGSVTDVTVSTSSTNILGKEYQFAGAAPTSTVSIGAVGTERTLTNVAAGRISATSTDAINGSQLFSTNSAITELSDRAVKYDLNADGTVNKTKVSMEGPVSTDGGKTGGTTISNLHQGAVNATSTEAINGAQLYQVAGDTSEAYTSVNGRGVRYVRTNDTGLVEKDAFAKGVGSNAQGYNAQANGDKSIANGFNSTANGENSVAIGAGSTANEKGSIALGAGSTTSKGINVAGASIAGDTYQFAGAKGAEQGTFSIGAVGAERQIQNVAAGRISATSTDGINGSQLFATNIAITKVGDRVTKVENNIVNLYQITGAIDARVTKVENEGVMYDVNNDNTVNYNSVTLGGKNSKGPTIIHNLADGIEDNDAANVSQLNKAKQNLGGGVAIGIAMAGLTQANEPDRTMVTAAMGNYDGASSVAIGASRMFDNGKVIVKGGVGFGIGKGTKPGVALGFGFNL